MQSKLSRKSIHPNSIYVTVRHSFTGQYTISEYTWGQCEYRLQIHSFLHIFPPSVFPTAIYSPDLSPFASACLDFNPQSQSICVSGLETGLWCEKPSLLDDNRYTSCTLLFPSSNLARTVYARLYLCIDVILKSCVLLEGL